MALIKPPKTIRRYFDRLRKVWETSQTFLFSLLFVYKADKYLKKTLQKCVASPFFKVSFAFYVICLA